MELGLQERPVLGLAGVVGPVELRWQVEVL